MEEEHPLFNPLTDCFVCNLNTEEVSHGKTSRRGWSLGEDDENPSFGGSVAWRKGTLHYRCVKKGRSLGLSE